jgi:hypothetical protein
MASNIGNAYMNSAANTGNAAMAAAGQRTSAFGGAANVLGRMYGRTIWEATETTQSDFDRRACVYGVGSFDNLYSNVG